MITQVIGEQSIQFENPVYIINSVSIVGKKEGQGPLGNLFDVICEDAMFGSKTWEEAESTLQKEAISMALGKAGMNAKDMRYLFAGDLLGQLIATSFGTANYNIPMFGLYGACSTCGESLGLGSMVIAGGFAQNVLCVTSSHFASAEKQFRFPLEYGNQRPLSAEWTVTGAGAFVLSGVKNPKRSGQPSGSEEAKAKITYVTTGKIVDFGIKDSMNMGAAMAPAAADTIYQNLLDFNLLPKDYDMIITGDLGSIGRTLLIDLLKDKGFDISENHMDCGIEIFDAITQDVHAGGSGCGCSAVTLSAYILKQLQAGTWKKVLFVPTGALLSTVSFNEGNSVPGIAHAVVLESI